MKRITKLLNIILLLALTVTLSSCSLLGRTLKNDYTNNITNNIVEYKTMTIEDFESAVELAIEKVENAVIGISTKDVTKLPSGTSEDTVSVGSGVIYKRVAILNNPQLGEINGNIETYKYYVITNRHVIENKEITKTYHYYAYLGPEDLEIKAELVGYDEKVDLALLTFEHKRLIQPVTFADSSEIKKGSFAIAMGNPDGYNYYGSATFGIISGPLRYMSDDTDGDGISDFYAEYIQHDVAINPGNSGGGLFNIYGELLGINTLKLVNEKIDNMGFAIPVDTVTTIVLNFLEPKINIIRPRLGVMGSEVRALTPAYISEKGMQAIPDIYGDEQQYGIYVIDITKTGTLDGSGIAVDDIILKFDNIKITRTYVLTAKLNSLIDYRVGDKVLIEYYSRSSKTIKTVTVTLKGVEKAPE